MVESGKGDLAFPGIVNGTYAFNVTSIANYTSSPSSGTLNVDGKNIEMSISFTQVPVGPSPSSPTVLGLPAAEGYALIGGLMAALVVVAAVASLLSRWRKTPPSEEQASPPPESDASPTRADLGDPPSP